MQGQNLGGRSQNQKSARSLFRQVYHHLLLGFLLSCALLTVACAPKKKAKTGKDQIVKECVMAADQIGTLSARWLQLPIPIAFSQQSQFTPEEIAEVVAAAKAWNDFYQASMGVKAFNYGDDANPKSSSVAKPASVCSTGILQGKTYAGDVVIYKQGAWPYANHDAIALTSFCPMPAKPLPSMYMAIMEVNYQDFFVAGKKNPDMRSIMMHEFGHLLGLDHSCDYKDKAGFPLCQSPSLPTDYYTAVLFPIFRFDADLQGEQKRSLGANDQGRANCLYQDLVGTAP